MKRPCLADSYRLLRALIAAHTAVLVGYAGIFLLDSLDGCVPPLSTIQATCAWRPGPTWSMTGAHLALTLVLSTIVAAAAAATVSALRRMRRPAKPRPADQRDDQPAGRRRLVASLTGAAAVVLTATLAIAAASSAEPSSGRGLDAADSERLARSVNPFTETYVPAQTRAMQVASWRQYGGDALLDRFGEHWARLTEALPSLGDWARPGPVDLSPAIAICTGIRHTARDAGNYFRIPDPQAHQQWQTFLRQAERGGEDCEQAIDQRNRKAFLESIGTLTDAATISVEAYKRVDAVSRGLVR